MESASCRTHLSPARRAGFDAASRSTFSMALISMSRKVGPSSGVVLAFLMKRFRRLVQLRVTERTAVIQLHLEAAQCPEAEHRRWREHGHERIALIAPLHCWLLAPAMAPAESALSPRSLNGLSADEDDACARTVGEAIHRQAREFHRTFDTRLLQRNRAFLSRICLFGAVERGAVRQLRKHDQILLVLRRHEAARHDTRDQHGRAEGRIARRRPAFTAHGAIRPARPCRARSSRDETPC